jgi:hypothetical protein
MNMNAFKTSPITLVMAGTIAVIVWQVRGYLPLVGHILLVCVVVVIVAGTVFAVSFLISQAYHHFNRIGVSDVGTHGSIVTRRGSYEHIPARGMLPARAQTLEGVTTIIEEIEAPITPTATKLLANGTLQKLNKQGQILYGYDTEGNAHTGTIEDTRTSYFLGRSCSGKSVTLSFLMSQLASMHFDITVVDSNFLKERSLTNKIKPLEDAGLVSIARRQAEIEDTVDAFFHELELRISGEVTQAEWKDTILIIDEFTALCTMNRALFKKLSTGLLRIANQGSGYNCYVWLAGQNIQASLSGGSALKNSLHSAVVGQSASEESSLLLPLATSKLTPQLKPGNVYLRDTSGDLTRLIVPMMEAADIETVAKLLAPKTKRLPVRRQVETREPSYEPSFYEDDTLNETRMNIRHANVPAPMKRSHHKKKQAVQP